MRQIHGVASASLLLVFTWEFHLGDACTADSQCQAHACVEQDDGICLRAKCDAEFGICSCEGAAAIRTDGRCTHGIPAGDADVCSATHHVVTAVAMWAGPELRASNVTNTTGPFGTILRHCVSSALRKKIDEVSVSAVTVVPFNHDSMHEALASAGHIVFDWSFSFCSSDFESVDAAIFEDAFGFEAQKFAAFGVSVLRLLQLRSFDRSKPSVTTSSAQQKGSANEQFVNHDPVEDDLVWFEKCWWAFWLFAVLVAAFVVGLWFFFRCRRHREERTFHQEQILGPDGVWLTRLPQATIFACDGSSGSLLVLVDLSYLPKSDPPEAHLTLNQGDVVEVFACGRDWFLGRSLVDFNVGFFPAKHVKWADPLDFAEIDTVRHSLPSSTPLDKPDTRDDAAVIPEINKMIQVVIGEQQADCKYDFSANRPC